MANEVTVQIDGVDGAVVPHSVRIEDTIGKPRKILLSIPWDEETLPQALLRKGVQLDIAMAGCTRRFEGIVLRAREGWVNPTYELVVGGPLDFLGLSSDCRIFQEMTVPEIVTQVMKDAGIPAARIVNRLTGTYTKLASCTQYNETMLAFVTRLLEAEGAFFFFEDGSSGLDIVLGDSVDAHKPATPAAITYAADEGALAGIRMKSLVEVEGLRPQKVTLRDLDWQKPALDLESTIEKTSPGARELYDHPGGYTLPADGKKRAGARLDALVASATGIRAKAFAPHLSAGQTFELEEAPREDLSVEWLLTEVVHAWDAAGGAEGWTTDLRALPKAVPFRPLATTKAPRIAGPQTAFVTGPSGQEIHTDANGCVKLKFHWDRHAKFDEKSSAWVRVAQLAMSGGLMVPRIGWEVVVEFEHGDPDRPIVIGRVYNAMYLPPYPLPSKQTVSTLGSYTSPGGAGHNEIRIDDAAGSEHIHMHAQKDMELVVANDRKAHITTSRMVTVKVDEAITVKGNRSLEVKGLWDVTVAGNQTLGVEGARTKTVKKDERVTVNGNRTVSVTGNHAITTNKTYTFATEGNVAATITGKLDETADEATAVLVGDDMSVTVGAAKMETAKAGKTSTIEGKQTVTIGGAAIDVSGADLSLLVGGKRTSTIGAGWTVTSSADVELSSTEALEMTIGAAMTMTGATTIALKVGGSKVTIGNGGITIDSAKVKVISDGPASILAPITLSN